MNDSPPFDLPPARTNWTPPWRASAGTPLGLGDLFLPVEVLLFFGAMSFVGNVYGLAWK